MVKQVFHYYGDIIRKLFIAAGIVMLVTLPANQDYLPIPLYVAVVGSIIFILLAGLMNPMHRVTLMLSSLAALVGLFLFEWYAVQGWNEMHRVFFVSNQILAILFLFASYYGVKSVRGMYVGPDIG